MNNQQINSIAPEKQAVFQSVVDLVYRPCAILSVERGPDNTAGIIRIVCANEEYKRSMGGRFYDGMPYYELVPKMLKFEGFCYRAAFLNQQVHTYLEVQLMDAWIDETLLPLHSDREDLGYCQLILELSAVRDRERMAAVSINTAAAVLKAAITLLGTTDLKERVEQVLRDISDTTDAINVRVLLLDHENRRAINYAELLNIELPEDYVPPEEDPDQAVLSYRLVCSWEDTIGDGNSLIVTNEKEMDEVALRNPIWAQTIRAYGVTNLVLIPLRHEKDIIGYLYLCNFNPEKSTEIRELSETMSFFLATEIYNEVLLKRLDVMSHTDALTGLNNRNAMIRRTSRLAESEEPVPFGIVNLDLNGLKLVNDIQGHDAGDRLLVSAAETLKRHFYAEDLYRTGGDEFIVISTGITEDAFNRKVERLRHAISHGGDLSFAIGEVWSDGSIDVNTAFRRADEKMYADKKAFYMQNPDKRR